MHHNHCRFYAPRVDIYHEDPRVGPKWYCQYYMGRRPPDEDIRQIKRWNAMRRHWPDTS